jgi:hypothetical protein
MDGNPAEFEALGNRLGFLIVEKTPEKLRLLWQGARFPAFLCLGLALLLLFVSVPIVQALRLRGFVGPASSLWYFPLMNLILFGISIHLMSQRRTIVIEQSAQRVTLSRYNLYRTIVFSVNYREIVKVQLGMDQVFSGFAIAGSSAAVSFPVPALRLLLAGGKSVLLDRGSSKKLRDLGQQICERLNKQLDIDPQLRGQAESRGTVENSSNG